MEHGGGQRFHALSNISFKSPTEAKTYAKDTGLSPMPTKQDWGTPDIQGSRPQTQMHRSRRGSIVGLSPMPDGSIKAWRLHSLPTSEAIKEGATTSQGFSQAFESSAKKLSTPAVNSKGKAQSVNSILSDVGKVRFNNTTSKFDFVDVTHAMGVSGSGLDKKQSSPPTDFYQPSITVAKQSGKAGRPEQTYHSEPMAVTLHNDSRTTPLTNETGLIGSFASFPNQVCRQCGDMLQANVGSHGVFTGVPGRPFGGQKEGDMFSQKSGSTVSRAAPMSELIGDNKNRQEVSSLFSYHK